MKSFSGRTICTIIAAALLVWTMGCSPPPPSGPNVVDADAPTEFTSTDSGLKYRILRRGNGKKPTASSRVTVDYSGWLDNGMVFDSSYERHDSTSFSLGNVVPGWTEGMQLVSEGGMIELEVPPELGYGARGQPPMIPPNATLHFKVELISFR